MIGILKAVISIVLAVANVFALPFVGHMNDYFKAKAPEEVRMNLAVISDTHVQDSVIRQAMLELGLEDMEKSYTPIDALLITGDITDHGYKEQYDRVLEAFAGRTPAQKILPVQGNHDTWTRDSDDGDYSGMIRNFTGFVKEVGGPEIATPYYSQDVNGYHLIFLASEYDHTDAYVSDAQLQWLEGEMNEAAESGKPIFVFCHWPINQTHGLPKTWGDKDYDPQTGGLGDQSDAVEQILMKYDNVFYITGHIHSGFSSADEASFRGYASIEERNGLHLVNLPCYMYFSLRGYPLNGTGYMIEVYDGEVLFRARNFATGIWHTKYDVSVPLE